MRTVAITGGCGFVGRYLTKRLVDENLQIRVFDNVSIGKEPFPLGFGGIRDYTFIRLDINNIDLLEKNLEGVDVLIHLAGISSRHACIGNPYGAFMSNVLTAASLMECARRCDVKNIVFASTIRITNTNIFSENDPYTISKYLSELWFKATSNISGARVNILRFSNIYGPGQSKGTVIQDFMTRAERGEYPVKYEGERKVSFLYIDDAVDAVYHVIETSTSSNSCNITGMDDVSLFGLADLITEEAVNSGVKFDKKELKNVRPDIQLIKPELNGWAPKVGIKEGISRTWKYYYKR
ncbi:MAG: NAD(P)-dependent oxidoreductase [Nitrospirae bacterium]|nr:NAD(P)-dependent oxidoreductase [Nitrospirota bacterium]